METEIETETEIEIEVETRTEKHRAAQTSTNNRSEMRRLARFSVHFSRPSLNSISRLCFAIHSRPLELSAGPCGQQKAEALERDSLWQ